MLSKWADENDEHPEDYQDHNQLYLSLYAGICLVEGVTEFSREITHFYNSARASKKMHESLLYHVLRSVSIFIQVQDN